MERGRGRGRGGGGGNRGLRPFRGRGTFRSGVYRGRAPFRGFHRETLGRRYDQDSVRRGRNDDRNEEEDDLTAKFYNQVEQFSVLLSMDEHDSVQRTVYSKPHDSRFSTGNSEINVLNERMQRQSLSDPDCLGRTARRPVFNRTFQGHTQDSRGSGFKGRGTYENTVRESSSGFRSRERVFRQDFGGRERTYGSSRTSEIRDDSRDRSRQVDKGRKQRASWIPEEGIPAVDSDRKKTPGNQRGDVLDTGKRDQQNKSGRTELGRHRQKIQHSPKVLHDVKKQTASHEKSNENSDKTQPENNKGIDLELSDISSEESDDNRNNSSNVRVEAGGSRRHLVEGREEGIERSSRSGHCIEMLNRSYERYSPDRRALLSRDSDISIQGRISRRDAHAHHRRPSSLERDREWVQQLGCSLSKESCSGHTRDRPRQRQKVSYRSEYSSKEREASLLGKWIKQRTPATSSSPDKSDCDIQHRVASQNRHTSREGADICRQRETVIASSSSRQRGEQENIDVSVPPREKEDTYEEREQTDESFSSRDRRERYHGNHETIDSFDSQEVEEKYLDSHEIIGGSCPKERERNFAIRENMFDSLDSQVKHHDGRAQTVKSSSSSGKEDEYCSRKEKTVESCSSVERKNRPRQYRKKRAESSSSGDDKCLGDQVEPEESSSSSERQERNSVKQENSIASSCSSERHKRYPGERKTRLETSSSSESENGHGREREERSTSSEDSHRRDYTTGTSSSSQNDMRYSDSESSSFRNSGDTQRRYRKRLRSSTPLSDYRRPTHRSQSRSKGRRYRDRTSDDKRSRSRSFESSDSEVEERRLPVRQTLPKVQFGYGRHVFSSLSDSRRSRSRSVSVARSKIQFYDRFNYRSKMYARDKTLRKEQERRKAAAWRSILEAKLTVDKDSVHSTSLVEATQSLQISVKSVGRVELSGDAERLKEQDSKLKDSSPRKHCLSQEQTVLKPDCKSALSISSKPEGENTTLQQSPNSSYQTHTVHSKGVHKKTISPGKELVQIPSPGKKSLFLQGVTSATSIMRFVRPPVSAQKKSFWNDVQQSRRRPPKEYTPLKKSTNTDVVKPSPSTSSSFEEVFTEPVNDSLQPGSDKSLPPSSKLLQKGSKSTSSTKLEGDDEAVPNASGKEPQIPVSEAKKPLNENYPINTHESSGSSALTQQDVWNIPLPKSSTPSPIKSTDLKPRVIQLPVTLRIKSAKAKQIYKEVELKDVTVNHSASSESKSELNSASVSDTDLKSETKVESSFIRLSTSNCLSDHEEVDMDLDDEDEEHKISLEEDTSWMSSGTDQRIVSEGSSTSTMYSSVAQPVLQIPTAAKRSPDTNPGSVQLGVTFPHQLPHASSQRLSGTEQSPPKPVPETEEQSIIPHGQTGMNSQDNLSLSKSALETEVPQGVKSPGELQTNAVPKVSFKLQQSRVPLLIPPAQLSPPASPARSSKSLKPIEICPFTSPTKFPALKVQASSFVPTSQPVKTPVSKPAPGTGSVEHSVASPKESPTTISPRSNSDCQQRILPLPVPRLQLSPIPSFKPSNLQQISLSQNSSVSSSLQSSVPQPVPPPHQSSVTSPNLLSSGFLQTSQPQPQLKPLPRPYLSPTASPPGLASGFLETSHAQVVSPPHHTPISPPGASGSLQISQPKPVPPPLQSPPASSQCLSGNYLPTYMPLPVPSTQELPGTQSQGLLDIFSQTSVREPVPQPVPPPELSPKTSSQGLSVMHNMIPLPVPPPQQSPTSSSQLLSSSCLPAPVPQPVPPPVSPTSFATSPRSKKSNQRTTKTSSSRPVNSSGHNAKTQQASQSKYLRQLKTVLRKSMSKLAEAVPKQSSRSVAKHESSPAPKSTLVNPHEDYDSEEYDAPSPYSSSSGSPMDIDSTEESKIEVFQPVTKQDLPIQDTSKFVSLCQTASIVPSSTHQSDVSRTPDTPKTPDTTKTADNLNIPGSSTPQSAVKQSRDPRLQARARKQDEAKASLVIKDVVSTLSRPPGTSASKMEPKLKTVAVVARSPQSCGRSSLDAPIGSGSMSHPCGIVSSPGRSVPESEDHRQYISRPSEAVRNRPQSFEDLTDGGYWGIPPDLDAGYTSDGKDAAHRPTLSRSLSVGCPVGQSGNITVGSRDDSRSLSVGCPVGQSGNITVGSRDDSRSLSVGCPVGQSGNITVGSRDDSRSLSVGCPVGQSGNITVGSRDDSRSLSVGCPVGQSGNITVGSRDDSRSLSVGCPVGQSGNITVGSRDDSRSLSVGCPVGQSGNIIVGSRDDSRSLSVGCPVGQSGNGTVGSRDYADRHLQDVIKSVASFQGGNVTGRYSVPPGRAAESRGKEDEDYRTKNSNSLAQIPGTSPKPSLQGNTDVHRENSDLEDKLLLVNTKKQGPSSKRPLLAREGSAGGSSVCTDLSTKVLLGTIELKKPESDQSDDHRRKDPIASPKESSPNQVERSPVSVTASPQGSALRLIPSGTESRESLFSEKVRGMSHRDVSDWVKKSSNQQQLDLEIDQCYSSKPMKKKHIDGEKRRHHSSPNSKSHTSSPRSSDGDRHRSESGTKGDVRDRNKIRSSQSFGKTVKKPKADIRRFFSQDASPRNKDGDRTRTVDYASEDSYEIPEAMDVDTPETVRTPSKSKMVLDSLRLSKFKSNLVKSPAFKAKPSSSSTSSALSESSGSCRPTHTPTRRTADVCNPLGSYRIPKLSSALSEPVLKEIPEEKSEAAKKKDDDALSESEAGSDSVLESDDDLFNETPAFLKEFEKTSKAILEAGMRPGTPEHTQSESVLSDDSFLIEASAVSCSTKPGVSRTTEAKSAFSLDALLAEKVENEEADRELHLMQNQLKEGIRQGGFIKVAEAEAEDSDDDLLPEHQQKLEYFQVSESTIQDHHPGDLVFHPGTFPCVFSEALSPTRCGFLPSNNFLEKHLANIAPDALCDLLTTDMLSICFHKITRQEEILQWIFYIMSVHRNSQVIQGCKKLLFDIIHTQLSQEDTSYSWAPAALDVLKVFVNFGACSDDLLPDHDIFSQEEIRTCVTPEDDSNLAPDNNNVPVRLYSENLREVLQTLAFALQGRPQYTASQLSTILLMTTKAALDKEFNNNKLLYEFSVLVSSVLPCYTQQDWDATMPMLCTQLSCITSHHHNHVYLTQLFPHGKRGSSIQRRLAYLLLVKMLQPGGAVSHQQLATFKLNQLTVLFPALRELATDDLYALASGVALLDIAVGSEPLNSEEKDYLQLLMEQLRTLTSDVRDNVRRLDHTRVKDLMVRISSKWTVTLQATSSKQRSLFAWTKQKSPQKMQVQRLETGSSDQDSEEEEEDEEVPDGDPSDKPDDMSVPMETDPCVDIGSKFQEVSHTVVPSDGIVSSMESSGKPNTVNSKGCGDTMESGDMVLKSEESGSKRNIDSTLTIGDGDGSHLVDGDKSSLEATLPGLEMNQNNHALAVSDPVGHQHIKVETEVKVVLTGIGQKGCEDIDISSGDESLPELDIV